MAAAAAAEAATATAVAAATVVTAAEAAARAAILIQAHLGQRNDDLVEDGKDLLELLVGEGRHELDALAALGLRGLGSALLSGNDDGAHVLFLGEGARDQAGLLGLGHHGVELAQANAEQLGHLLLLHLGLELEELDGAHDVVHALVLRRLLVADVVLAVAQQARGSLGLVEENLVGVDRGLLDLLGLLLVALVLVDLVLDDVLVELLVLGHVLGQDLLVLGHDLVVLAVLRHESPSSPSGVKNAPPLCGRFTSSLV